MHTWFEPEAGAARAVVVFAPAMGVRQDYYAEFANHLAAHQFLVGTMDYRAMGFNEPASLRGENVTFSDWQIDIENLIEAAAQRAPGLPLILCGHSLGGQLLGTLRNRRHIAAVLTVASGTGYWGHNPKMRLQLLYLWYVAMPVLTRLCGYFPGKRLNKVGNLPREIALTWARWCRDPRYLMGDPAVLASSTFDQVTLPMLSLSFADDDYIPKAAVEHLHGFYVNAQVERRHVHPREVGSQRIGHFGFFKLGGASTLATNLGVVGHAYTQREMQMNRVLSLWDSLSTKPLGKWMFSRIICFKAPYFATISPRFEELRPGFSRVSMSNRRAVHNHIKTIHAIALCNLAEIGAGTMMEASLSKDMRWLPKGMNVKYLKKAETDVVAHCTAPDIADGEPRESVVSVDIKDIHGATVCHADVIMWVSPKKAKTSG